jgi:3-hydroxyisobutyrate dehydrogenase
LKIGFAGLGLMGLPMVHQLLAAGFAVNVWNRSKDKLGSVMALGAVPCDTPADLTKASDVLMLCLADTAAVEEVVFGPSGIATVVGQCRILIDFSSISPLAAQEFAATLKNSCDMTWIDAPVSGGTVGAERGELVIMAGGESAALDQIRPALRPLSLRVTHMGDTGSGQMAKLCNQMIVACNAAVIAEMVALGRAAGIDVARLPAALAGGFGDSRPLQILVPQMAAEDFELKWKVRTLLKDLGSAVAVAKQFGRCVPMSEMGLEVFEQHGLQGYLDQDVSTLIQRYT